MSWHVEQKVLAEDQPDDGRDFVTDGKESFHVDRMGAERLAELLNLVSHQEPEPEAAKT